LKLNTIHIELKQQERVQWWSNEL